MGEWVGGGRGPARLSVPAPCQQLPAPPLLARPRPSSLHHEPRETGAASGLAVSLPPAWRRPTARAWGSSGGGAGGGLGNSWGQGDVSRGGVLGGGGGTGLGESDKGSGCSPPLETGISGIPGGGSLVRSPSAGLESDQRAGLWVLIPW